MHGARFPAGLILALWTVACSGSDRLDSAEGELRVSPSALVIPGYAGYSSEAPVRLQNIGRTELVVQVEIEGPFQTRAGPYRLPGAADVTEAIVFAPQNAGEYKGVVRYHSGDRVFEVALTGYAVFAEPCVPDGPCDEARFDPSTGECHHGALADDTPCETGNACWINGVCRNRECLEEPLDCDDQDDDPCTVYRCDPKRGCLPSSVVCDPPDNICERAECKREAGGCVTVSADGKTCGETAEPCKNRYVCLRRECQLTDVLDGFPCFDTCGRGTCENEVCVRETPDAMDEPGWTSEPVTPAIREVLFPGLVAGDGTVVWFEPALDGSDTLLAAAVPGADDAKDDPPFAQRYRVEMPAGVPGRAGAVLAGDMVVVALDGPGGSRVLEARFLCDGLPAWGPIDVAALLDLDPAIGDLEVLALVEGERGEVRVVAAAASGTAVLWMRANGMLDHVLWLDGTPVAVDGEPVAIADADGRMYLTLRTETDRRVVSLFRDFAETPRWTRQVRDDDGGALAVADGLLVIAPGRVLDTATGEELFDLPVWFAAGLGIDVPASEQTLDALAVRSPLLVGAAGFAVLAGEDPDPPVLVSYGLTDGASPVASPLVLPNVSGRGAWTPPVLTTRNNAVVAVQLVPEDGGLVSGLLEVRADGKAARACLIPGLGELAGPPAIGGGWFAFAERHGAVKFYELRRGAEPAARGWTGPHGGPSGGNRERP